MAQGGGNAMAVNKNVVVVGGMLLFLLCVLQCVHLVEGATYVVGGSTGWNLEARTWPDGKKFRAGDILVFNYNTTVHNVVIVCAEAYQNCSTAGITLTSGKDKVPLWKGTNYFICGKPGHCAAGMKIAVVAT